ncbi:hypothetical protein BDV95DRAFT_610125 [Massariosphaeria phaeospora]|uniref:Ankyrin repeat-containing domain protein n=1 Tax=Massariosphaeria phaeospora TaxID=100035 RepID=A0A7C8M411_9PLEO|nr:hypothetical protein BDV95DRAFT_610125 [Massariosphaeria phaeospora]
MDENGTQRASRARRPPVAFDAGRNPPTEKKAGKRKAPINETQPDNGTPKKAGSRSRQVSKRAPARMPLEPTSANDRAPVAASQPPAPIKAPIEIIEDDELSDDFDDAGPGFGDAEGANETAAVEEQNPINNSLKRSPSEADLEKEESTSKAPNSLKRTLSKLDISEAANKVPSTGLKRTQSKMDLTELTKIPATPLKRTQSKMDLGQPSSNLPRAQSTDGNPSAKRVKRTTADDAATTRPTSRDGRMDPPQQIPATPAARKITSQTALPRLAARLMTPIKSSIARSQSVKTLKSTLMAPSLLRSPSARALFSPTSIGQAMKEGVREGMRKTSNSLNQVRSLLRTPHRKYSADPKKIAASTHMSPPPGLDLAKELPKVPVTAPVKKQVNFTNSTLERAVHDELGKSPSPMKLRAGSKVLTGAVIYPSLQSGIEYPSLTNDAKSPSASPSWRLTFGEGTTHTSSEFSFRSGNPINFGPPSTSTIRVVTKTYALSLGDGKKRKLETVKESFDKENNGPAADEGRSAKKMKLTLSELLKTPSSVPQEAANVSIGTLDLLLAHGWDINSQGDSGSASSGKPFMWNVVSNEEMVEWCPNHGASVHPRYPQRCPPILEEVADRGTVSIYSRLLRKGAPTTGRLLHLAVEATTCGDPNKEKDKKEHAARMDIVRYLVDEVGLDINEDDQPKGRQLPMRNGTPICYIPGAMMLERDTRELTWYLLDRGADPTPAFKIAERDYMQFVEDVEAWKVQRKAGQRQCCVQ